MDNQTEVKIDRIVADLSKKFNNDPNHNVRIIQQYCQTLLPCERSAQVAVALAQYAAEKFPNADACKFQRTIDKTISELEKEFNDDPNHNVKVIQDYCNNLPKNEENLKLAIALGQYAASKFPDADKIKESKAKFDKMNEEAGKLKKRIDDIQEKIKNNELDSAIDDLRGIIQEAKMPEDTSKRLVSFSHPFEEIIFQATIKETKPIVRISNLMEMLNIQLGTLLAETKNFDEAREALKKTLFFNPVCAIAHLELARIDIVEKKYEDAFNNLQKAYPIIFTRQMLAVYFCLLAVVVENLDKNYPLAIAYTHISLEFAENTPAKDALERMASEHNLSTEKPSQEAIRKLADDAYLPIGANPEISELAIKAARQFKSSQPEIAKELFRIAYDLTGQKSLLKEIR